MAINLPDLQQSKERMPNRQLRKSAIREPKSSGFTMPCDFGRTLQPSMISIFKQNKLCMKDKQTVYDDDITGSGSGGGVGDCGPVSALSPSASISISVACASDCCGLKGKNAKWPEAT